MTVEGFAGFREAVRRAVRQHHGAPDGVLEAVETLIRDDHQLLLAAWDELKHRGAAVSHVTTSEHDRSCRLVDDVVPANGQDAAAMARDRQPVANALIAMVAQEVRAYRMRQGVPQR